MGLNKLKFVIKGAGEMGSGVAWRLHRAGFTRIVMLDTLPPLAVRRSVCFCEALYDGMKDVDGVTGVAVRSVDKAKVILRHTQIPVIADPSWKIIGEWKPEVVIDAILAKKNLGTQINEAEYVLGLGPGFCAGSDVHAVIETNRGPNCGRIIYNGCAQENTGIPGSVMGHAVTRVVRAPHSGTFRASVSLDDTVKAGDTIGCVANECVISQIDGKVRGLIRDETFIEEGVKIGDIEPRTNIDINRVSDKSLALAGGVLEAVLCRYNV